MVTWAQPASVAPRMPNVQAMPAEPDLARRLAMQARLMLKSAANSDPVAASLLHEARTQRPSGHLALWHRLIPERG